MLLARTTTIIRRPLKPAEQGMHEWGGLRCEECSPMPAVRTSRVMTTPGPCSKYRSLMAQANGAMQGSAALTLLHDRSPLSLNADIWEAGLLVDALLPLSVNDAVPPADLTHSLGNTSSSTGLSATAAR